MFRYREYSVLSGNVPAYAVSTALGFHAQNTYRRRASTAGWRLLDSIGQYTPELSLSHYLWEDATAKSTLNGSLGMRSITLLL